MSRLLVVFSVMLVNRASHKHIFLQPFGSWGFTNTSACQPCCSLGYHTQISPSTILVTHQSLNHVGGVFGCGEGAVYLTSYWGVQLILAFSWARLAILVAGKDRGECFYFFCFFTFISVLSSLALSFISSTISSILFLPFSGR